MSSLRPLASVALLLSTVGQIHAASPVVSGEHYLPRNESFRETQFQRLARGSFDEASSAGGWREWGAIPGLDLIAMRPVAAATGQEAQVGIRGGWARYRLLADDPTDPGLAVESMTRIGELGAKAAYIYLSPIVGSAETSLVQVAQSPRFQNVFAQAGVKQFKVLTLLVNGIYPGGLAEV